MLAADQALKYGLCREMCGTIFKSEMFTNKYGKVTIENEQEVKKPAMNKDQYHEMLSASGYRSQQKMMSSCMTPAQLLVTVASLTVEAGND